MCVYIAFKVKLAYWPFYVPFLREQEGLVMQLNIWGYLNTVPASVLIQIQFLSSPQTSKSVAREDWKCISHDFAPGHLAAVMRCLASCTTCILMGHKLFWFF